MALTSVISGAQVLANDADQFRQLLTGAMTDQAVTIGNTLTITGLSKVLGGSLVNGDGGTPPVLTANAPTVLRMQSGTNSGSNDTYNAIFFYRSQTQKGFVGFPGVGVGGPTIAGSTAGNDDFVFGTGSTGSAFLRASDSAAFFAGALTTVGALSAKLGDGFDSLLVIPSTGTNAATMRFTNSGDSFYIGLDSSIGNRFGQGNYSATIYVGGTHPLNFFTNAALRWQITSGGHLLAGTDNGYDIGASGATRPRNIYVATEVVAGTSYTAGGNPASSSANTSVLAHNGGSLARWISRGADTSTNGAFELLSSRSDGSNASTRWKIDGSGNLIAGSDNTYDIGASGATRPKHYWGAGFVDVGGSVSISGASSTWTAFYCHHSVTQTSGNTSGNVASFYGALLPIVSGGAQIFRAAQFWANDVAATVTGTLSNHNMMYLGQPSNGTTVRVIDTGSGAFLSTAGSWTNNPSWSRYKTEARDVGRAEIVDLYEWLRDRHKPKVYRHDGTPLDADHLDSPRPIHQSYEYDTFGFFLDDMPEKVRRIICADPKGGISTKDTDGFLMALVQEAARRIDDLERRLATASAAA